MPSQVTDIKEFLEIARRKDAKSARIKRSPITVAGGTKQKEQIKFKIRAKRHLHTLVLTDNSKAEKIKQSLPPALTITEINKKTKKPKKN